MGRKKHGDSKNKSHLYNSWRGMRARCYNKKDKSYYWYGARGITICDEWKNDYTAFKEWALSNGYEEGLTIERIDTNGNYEPSNCCWKTRKEQANNTRKNHLVEYNGKVQTISQWAEELNIDHDVLFSRINKFHWTMERAVNTKVNFRIHPEWEQQILQIHIEHPDFSGVHISKIIGCGETKVYDTLKKYRNGEIKYEYGDNEDECRNENVV